MMDLIGIGSLGMYAKSLRLKTQWDLKKSGGNVNSHDSIANGFSVETRA